jgi:hypothetical protein
MRLGRPRKYTPQSCTNVGMMFHEPDPRRRRDLLAHLDAVRDLKGSDDPAAKWAMEERPNGRFRRYTLLVEIGLWPEDEHIQVAQLAYRSRDGHTTTEIVGALRMLRLSRR